jgi:hypothetical protein
MLTALLVIAISHPGAPLPRSVADRSLFDGHWEIEEIWVGGQLTTYKEKPDQLVFSHDNFVWRNNLGEYLEVEGKWIIKPSDSFGKFLLMKKRGDGFGYSIYMKGMFRFSKSKIIIVAHDSEWPPHFGGAGSKESEFALLVLRRRK